MGKVTDGDGKPIYGVSVFLDTYKSVITNKDGAFSIIDDSPIKKLTFSKIGFKTNVVDVKEAPITVTLLQQETLIEEVTINANAAQIIQRAVAKIPENYSQKPFISKEFRRSVLSENDSIIYVQEMAVNTVKSYASKGKTKYYLLKNRSFKFTEQDIFLKNIGGVDVIRNLKKYFTKSFYKQYTIKKIGTTMYENDIVDIIEFYKKPKLGLLDVKGLLYINRKDYAIVKLDMAWGDGDEIVAEYKKIDNLYYMMRAEGRRIKVHSGVPRLANLEVVNVEITPEIPSVIDGEEVSATGIKSYFASDYYDTTFWDEYNTTIPNQKVSEKMKSKNK